MSTGDKKIVKLTPDVVERLNEAVKKDGRSQAEIAATARVRANTFGDWLSGAQPGCREAKLQAVCDVLGESFGWIVLGLRVPGEPKRAPISGTHHTAVDAWTLNGWLAANRAKLRIDDTEADLMRRYPAWTGAFAPSQTYEAVLFHFRTDAPARQG